MVVPRLTLVLALCRVWLNGAAGGVGGGVAGQLCALRCMASMSGEMGGWAEGGAGGGAPGGLISASLFSQEHLERFCGIYKAGRSCPPLLSGVLRLRRWC